MIKQQQTKKIVLYSNTREYELYQALKLLAEFFELDSSILIGVISLVAKEERNQEWNKLFKNLDSKPH